MAGLFLFIVAGAVSIGLALGFKETTPISLYISSSQKGPYPTQGLSQKKRALQSQTRDWSKMPLEH